ncbi:MAG: hypothetical protein K9N46_08430 [Candidatus Marinimicrobia bacterium]|nr:hypothetical protein [Candidatus Neomarinimicrobiota bacterium]MCF7828833.1 hypothetical protein [Candidatus Neomarinimicrobiota bacterium]MCF7880750.1 hypothetical protein [Candidatus Neomarinimicrobiota bacterium]
MLSDRLVRLVERQAERLERQWLKNLQSHPATPSYHDKDDIELTRNVREVYNHLGKYMNDEYDPEELAHFLMEIGARRREEEVPLSELTFAIILARRNLWDFIMGEGIITSSLEWYQVNEFWQRAANFFDKNIYFIVHGYENAEEFKQSPKDTISKLLHAFSLGILPEVDKQKVSQA